MVTGNLPICPADEMRDFSIYESMSAKKYNVNDEDTELATAIQMSLNDVCFVNFSQGLRRIFRHFRERILKI